MNDDHDKELLREIHSAVIGNETLGHEGLVKKVARHEKWIVRADIKAALVVGGAGTIVFLIELFFIK